MLAGWTIQKDALPPGHDSLNAVTLADLDRLGVRDTVLSDERSVVVPLLSAPSETPKIVVERPDAAAKFRFRIRAAAVDIFRTGHVTESRAKGLAVVATTEALRHGIPPALLIGVIRVENDVFRSGAKSSVRATGLMQVMPFWLKEMKYRFGDDLSNDTTNIRMGAVILAGNIRQADGDWREALLRYNGCKANLVSANCLRYPDKVRNAVMRDATFSCGGASFETCVVRPLHRRFTPMREAMASSPR